MQYNNLQLDQTFTSHYEVTPRETVAASIGTLYGYPGALQDCTLEGPLLEVIPHQKDAAPWVGSFGCGDISSRAYTGVYSLPSPEKILVIARGDAFVVHVHNPQQYEQLSILPVMGVVPVPEHQLMVFYDFTTLVGFDGHRCIWRTPQISWDGLRKVSCQDGVITGEAWDSPENQWVSFAVNPKNGTVTGGAEHIPA